jgi:hypothetical protein
MSRFSQKKQYLVWIAPIAGFFLFLLIGKTNALVVINPPSGTTGGSCMVASSVTSLGPESLFSLVLPDGTDDAMTGAYNMNINCTPGVSACDAVVTAMQQATAQGNALGPDFPQYTDGPSNNTVNFNFTNDNSECGNYSNGSLVTACESTSEEIISGVTFTTANVYINTNGVDYNEEINNPAQLMCIMQHEMTHGFGYDDTYTHIDNDPGVMGNGCQSDSSPSSWAADAPLVSSIEKQNTTGQVTVPNNNACFSLCPANQVAIQNGLQYSCVAVQHCPPLQLAAGWTNGTTSCLPPILPPGKGCTDNQLAEGGVNSATAAGGCLMPSQLSVVGCTCSGNDYICTLSDGSTNSNPNPYCNPSPATHICGSGIWDDASQSCTCPSGQAYDSVVGTCTSANAGIVNNCTCAGSNEVCTLSDDSIITNYNPVCNQENQSNTPPPPPACDPTVSNCSNSTTIPPIPPTNPITIPPTNPTTPTTTNSTDPNATCTTNNDGSQTCLCSSGYYYPSSDSPLCQPVPNCSLTPGDPTCSGNLNYCLQNPNGPGCPAVAPSTDEYCALYPADSDCESYCAQYSADPACSGDINNGIDDNGGNNGDDCSIMGTEEDGGGWELNMTCE